MSEQDAMPRPEWERPPGIILVGILLVLLLLIVESASRLAELLPIFAVIPIAIILLVWLVRFAVAVRLPGEHDARSWLRWLLVPALVGGTVLLVAFDMPFHVRLELSRPAMTSQAEIALADPASRPPSFGLFDAVATDVTEGDLSFLIAGSGFIDTFALTYSPDGRPADPYGDLDFRDLGGGWWLWPVEF